MATHLPQSLPSFAQAFSTPSFNSMSSGSNALPPIQVRHASLENMHRVHSSSPSGQDRSRKSSAENTGAKLNGRKRPRQEPTPAAGDDEASDSDRNSPRLVRIKEEEQEVSDPSPPPPLPPIQSRLLHPRPSQDLGAPAPSSLRPSASKRRRVTISGAPHALNTDLRSPSVDHSNSTPISPVVMGFTIMRDDPAAIEQVRSMITVKQKQKALIEQRRGSAAGVMVSTSQGTSGPSNLSTTSTAPAAVSVANAPADDRRNVPKPPAPVRPERRSPNTGAAPAANNRRGGNIPSTSQIAPPVPNDPRPPSPSPMIVPSQQPQIAQAQTNSAENRPVAHTASASAPNSLPPPPISFARRRAGKLGAGKKKPADIVISPREAHTAEQLAPFIQSAPPVPHAGQSQSFTGRFPMALPRLPSAMSAEQSVRRFSTSQVPPTPTRLAMQRSSAFASSSQPGISSRSPPAASVPIATTLIPPTPSSLHHPSYSGDKSAFLAPFEVFYDALNDSKQLKNWLSEQMQKSNALLQSLTQQQDKLDETVDRLVEKKMTGMRTEISGLHRRVEELEDALRAARADRGLSPGRRQSTDVSGGAFGKSRSSLKNGMPPVPVAPVTYTFPPVDPPRSRPELPRRISSPGWGREGDAPSVAGSDQGSPGPFDANRRLSISSMRLDPPRPPPPDVLAHSRPSFSGPSPSQREGPTLPPPPSAYPKGGALPPKPLVNARAGHPLPERPPLQRQQSSQRTALAVSQSEAGPSPKLGSSRRNSIIMSPPEDRSHGSMDES